jgi:hypothetical protein
VSIRFADITSLVKDKTALFIPNAITVIANDEKYFFTSFASRDKVFDLLQQLWKVTTTGQVCCSTFIVAYAPAWSSMY